MSTGVAAIVLAGGSGSRIQREVNKVYLPIGDRELLRYPLETVDRSPLVDRIVLVVRPEDEPVATRILADVAPVKPTSIIHGGSSRHESEHAGLESLAGEISSEAVSLVAIHDGARPFMTLDLLEAILTTAHEHGGAIPGLPVEEPLYRIDGDTAHQLDPTTLRKVQTPQAFQARALLSAYRQASEAGFAGVDTAETVERFTDLEVVVVNGDPRNIKVTFIEDFFAAEDYVLDWRDGRWTDESSQT